MSKIFLNFRKMNVDIYGKLKTKNLLDLRIIEKTKANRTVNMRAFITIEVPNGISFETI